MTQTSTDPRREAARIIGRVLRDGAYANRLLHAVFQTEEWDPRDRGLLTELVYGVIRHLYTIDHALDQVIEKGLRSIDPAILNHLRVATYQILYLDRIAPHAVVSQAVRYIRQLRGQRVAGFANALLRNIQRNPERFVRIDPLLPLPETLSLVYSHPLWLVQRWLQRFGPEQTQQRLQTNNQSTPLVFRFHGPSSQRTDVLQKLHHMDVSAEPTTWSPHGIRIHGHLPLPLHRFLEEFPYRLVPQDEAAQLIVSWLDPQNHETILDTCAAPGGKTSHINLLAPLAQVTACDIHPHKIQLIQDLCQRLQIPSVLLHPAASTTESPQAIPGIQLLQQDASQPFHTTYDRILCDAPCSGLGILRKQPEIRYRRNEADIQERARFQEKLLHNLASAVRPGGILMYAVCTDTPEENEQVVEAFLQSHPEFTLCQECPHPSWEPLFHQGYLHTSPEHHNMDAFFAAKLQKQPT